MSKGHLLVTILSSAYTYVGLRQPVHIVVPGLGCTTFNACTYEAGTQYGAWLVVVWQHARIHKHSTVLNGAYDTHPPTCTQTEPVPSDPTAYPD